MIETLLSYNKIKVDGIYGLLQEDLTSGFNGSILGANYYGLLI
jgi:hypothetical protein